MYPTQAKSSGNWMTNRIELIFFIKPMLHDVRGLHDEILTARFRFSASFGGLSQALYWLLARPFTSRPQLLPER